MQAIFIFHLSLRRALLKELQDMFSNDRSPTCPPLRPDRSHTLDNKTQTSLTNFSLLTHGFGTPTFQAVLSTLQNHFSEMIKAIDKTYPAVPGQMGNGSSSSGQGNGLDIKLQNDKGDVRRD